MCLCCYMPCMLMCSKQRVGVQKRLSRATYVVWEGSVQVLQIFFIPFCIEVSIVYLGIQILISLQENFGKLVLHLNIYMKSSSLALKEPTAWCFACGEEGHTSLQWVGQEMLLPWKSTEVSSWQRAFKPLLNYTTQDRFHMPWPTVCNAGAQSSETAAQIS